MSENTDKLVNAFAEAMKKKFIKAEENWGKTDGWREKDWEIEWRCDIRNAIAKGDPIDIANYCAMGWIHGWSV